MRWLPRTMNDLIRARDPDPDLLDTDQYRPEWTDLAEALAHVGRVAIHIDTRFSCDDLVVYDSVSSAGRLGVRRQALMGRWIHQDGQGRVRLDPRTEARTFGARLAAEVRVPDWWARMRHRRARRARPSWW